MKRVIFVDRDGTIIVEPPVDYQVDSLEKLEFVAGAISGLKSVAELDYELVMASNQDGLGTDSFPEETFWPAHTKMLRTLAGEGVFFDDQLIDPTRGAVADAKARCGYVLKVPRRGVRYECVVRCGRPCHGCRACI